MKSILEFPPASAKELKYLFCDIDDTITTDGKVTKEAYSALWDLHDAGVEVIPVTGRPAGWCDLIVRQWPVRAVVGENGAFVYYFEDSQLHTFTHPSVAENVEEKLEEIKVAVLQEFPLARVSKDQFSRLYDLAIDFNEDPPHLGLDVAEDIRALCERMGAEAKVSSIHVNTWFGDYDKVSMTRLFMEEVLGVENLKETSIFFGDSPNDAPMFGYFPHAVAVENIRPFLEDLEHRPSYIAEGHSGEGFAHAVDFLLSRR